MIIFISLHNLLTIHASLHIFFNLGAVFFFADNFLFGIKANIKQIIFKCTFGKRSKFFRKTNLRMFKNYFTDGATCARTAWFPGPFSTWGNYLQMTTKVLMYPISPTHFSPNNTKWWNNSDKANWLSRGRYYETNFGVIYENVWISSESFILLSPNFYINYGKISFIVLSPGPNTIKFILP